jgi:hypothetical protein
LGSSAAKNRQNRQRWSVNGIPQQETPPTSLKLTGLPGNRGTTMLAPFRTSNGGRARLFKRGSNDLLTIPP